MLTTVENSQSEILETDEDGADQISNHEQKEAAIMHMWIMDSIVDRQQDQTQRTSDGEENGDTRAGLIPFALVGHQFACMSEPAFREKREVEEDHGDNTTGNEERLEPGGSNVGYITRPGG